MPHRQASVTGYAKTLSRSKAFMPESHLEAILELTAKFGPYPAKNIESIVCCACELLSCDCAAFGRIEEGIGRLRLPFSCNLPPRPSPVREAIRTLCRQVTLGNGSGPAAAPTRQMPDYELPPACEFKGFLGYPVQLDGSPIGALVAFRTSRRQFAPRDEQIIALLAKTMAVQDAWLTRERSLLKRATLEKRIEEISTLAIAVDCTSSFLERCLELIGKAMNAGGAYWWEFDPKSRTFGNTAEWIARDRSSQKASMQGVPVESVPWAAGRLMGGHILKIEDVNKVPIGRERDIFQSLGVRAAVLLPLFSCEVFFGFIGLEDYDGPRHWSAEDISSLQITAEIMMRGIENKNLTDELAGHRRALKQQLDEKTIDLLRANQELTAEVDAHRLTIEALKKRETELRNRNQAFEALSDRLSLLLQEKGKTIVDIEALLADRVRARFKRTATAACPSATSSKQIESIQNRAEGITAPHKGSRFDLYAHFTPAEIKIAEFLKLGLSSKKISRLLGISDRTVQVHCLKIREKLGIKNKKVNLKAHLMSMSL